MNSRHFLTALRNLEGELGPYMNFPARDEIHAGILDGRHSFPLNPEEKRRENEIQILRPRHTVVGERAAFKLGTELGTGLPSVSSLL
jgi:hypothetical protein